ncbi:MAG: ParB N-terminal domain-containing protein [Desulfarculaceae bacterium]|nr:ParB N-terminal domain-containing protein [Desulfarculaceae bacterium]
MITDKSVGLSEIIQDDHPYRITTARSVDSLSRSVDLSGVLHPCILLKEGGTEDRGGYVVVSGHLRIEAMKQTGGTLVPARVVDASQDRQAALLHCARAAVMDNAFSRPLDMVEKAKGVALLNRYMSLEEIVKDSPALFNERLNLRIAENLLTLGRQPANIHRMVLESRLSIKTLAKLETFDPDIRDRFIRLFQYIKMGQNKQLDVVVHIQEIAAREDLSIAEFMDSEKVDSIVTMDHPDENLKSAHLRNFLAERRFPEKTKARQEYRAALKELDFGNAISLDPPRDFEGDTYRISFDFKTADEFNRALDKLIRARYSDRLRELIK